MDAMCTNVVDSHEKPWRNLTGEGGAMADPPI